MSTKLASDESNVENVSIKNRPMNVSEEYQVKRLWEFSVISIPVAYYKI